MFSSFLGVVGDMGIATKQLSSLSLGPVGLAGSEASWGMHVWEQFGGHLWNCCLGKNYLRFPLLAAAQLAAFPAFTGPSFGLAEKPRNFNQPRNKDR